MTDTASDPEWGQRRMVSPAPILEDDTLPVETTEPESAVSDALTDSQKIEIIRAQVEWLCLHMQALMTVAAKNPLFRMAMKGVGK